MTERQLGQISEMIGVPVSFFYAEDPAAGRPEAAGQAEADALQHVELLRLFLAMDDPEDRARCLAFVRSLAKAPPETPPETPAETPVETPAETPPKAPPETPPSGD
ncbi:hypothetical protein [Methylobacterium sp. A54F]